MSKCPLRGFADCIGKECAWIADYDSTGVDNVCNISVIDSINIELQKFNSPIGFEKEDVPIHNLLNSINSTLIELKNNQIDLSNEFEAFLRPPISNETKNIVLQRDNRRCRYCGSPRDLQIEHVTPIKRGGGSEIDNLVVACRKCNYKKGNKTLEEAGMRLYTQEEIDTIQKAKELQGKA